MKYPGCGEGYLEEEGEGYEHWNELVVSRLAGEEAPQLDKFRLRKLRL